MQGKAGRVIGARPFFGEIADQASWSRPRLSQFIHRISQRAIFQRQAAATDAAYNLIAELG